MLVVKSRKVSTDTVTTNSENNITIVGKACSDTLQPEIYRGLVSFSSTIKKTAPKLLDEVYDKKVHTVEVAATQNST